MRGRASEQDGSGYEKTEEHGPLSSRRPVKTRAAEVIVTSGERPRRFASGERSGEARRHRAGTDALEAALGDRAPLGARMEIAGA